MQGKTPCSFKTVIYIGCQKYFKYSMTSDKIIYIGLCIVWLNSIYRDSVYALYIFTVRKSAY